MEIMDGRIAAPQRHAGRATAVALALAMALSGAFALGRVTVDTRAVVRHDAVAPRVIVFDDRPMIRPKGRGTVKVDPATSAAGRLRHSGQWG
jgi:hypothetical protein